MVLLLSRLARPLALFLATAGACLFVGALFSNTIGTCPYSASLKAKAPELYVHWFDNPTVALFGWAGLFAGQMAWFANPCMAYILIKLINDDRPKTIFLILCLVFGLQSLAPIPLPHNEAYSEPVCADGLGAGLWMWTGCCVLFVLSGLLQATKHDPTA